MYSTQYNKVNKKLQLNQLEIISQLIMKLTESIKWRCRGIS